MEYLNGIRGTLTFLNGRVYKGGLSPIDGKFNGVLEIKGEPPYPMSFVFSKGKCIDFDEITNPSLETNLKYGYNPVFGISPDAKPFNKEEIGKLFNFDKYKKGGSKDVHIMIQHRIGNYDGDNIGYIPQGNGILTYKNGDIYEGEFKDGTPCGKGKLTFGKYGEMQGEFKDGMLNGEGKSLYPNRGEYEGEFKNGKPDGKGKVVYTKGEIHEGIREKGKFIG